MRGPIAVPLTLAEYVAEQEGEDEDYSALDSADGDASGGGSSSEDAESVDGAGSDESGSEE